MVWNYPAARRSATSWSAVCKVPGCDRYLYARGVCSDHYQPPPEKTCGHRRVVIRCGCCNRRVCEKCYGPWNALACAACRKAAR